MSRALRWLGPGSLYISHPDGNNPGAIAMGAGHIAKVPPFDADLGVSGIIRKPENITALGEARIADLIKNGMMIEFQEFDGPEKRSGQDRRCVDRRQS